MPQTAQSPYNPMHFEPELLRALQGLPAEAGMRPTAPASLLETLSTLASWMGMAIPGRGGLGPMGRSIPPPMRTRGRKPHETERLGKIVDQAFREWMRENVAGKSLPKTTPTEGFPVMQNRGPDRLPATLETEQDLYETLLDAIFASLIRGKGPGQSRPPLPPRGSANTLTGVAELPDLSGNMPLLRSSPTSHTNPLFWVVD